MSSFNLRKGFRYLTTADLKGIYKWVKDFVTGAISEIQPGGDGIYGGDGSIPENTRATLSPTQESAFVDFGIGVYGDESNPFLDAYGLFFKEGGVTVLNTDVDGVGMIFKVLPTGAYISTENTDVSTSFALSTSIFPSNPFSVGVYDNTNGYDTNISFSFNPLDFSRISLTANAPNSKTANMSFTSYGNGSDVFITTDTTYLRIDDTGVYVSEQLTDAVKVVTTTTRGYRSLSTNSTSNYSALTTDDVILFNGSGSITLPAAASNGKVFTIKNRSVGARDVLTQGATTINGAASYSMPANSSLDIIYENSPNDYVVLRSQTF